MTTPPIDILTSSTRVYQGVEGAREMSGSCRTVIMKLGAKCDIGEWCLCEAVC